MPPLPHTPVPNSVLASKAISPPTLVSLPRLNKRSHSDDSVVQVNGRSKRLKPSQEHASVRGGIKAKFYSVQKPSNTRSCSPIDHSSLEVATDMLSRAEQAGGNRTVRLARGTPSSPSSHRLSTRPLLQNGLDHPVIPTRHSDMRSSKGAQILSSLALTEFLQYDDRPVFIIDVAEESTSPTTGLNLLFANHALQSRPKLLDCVEGRTEDAALLLDLGTPFVDFKSWLISLLPAPDIVASFPFAGALWKATTLRRRLRVATAILDHAAHDIGRPTLSHFQGLGSSTTVRTAATSSKSSDTQAGYFDVRPSRHEPLSGDMQQLVTSSLASESPLSQVEQASTAPSGGDASIRELLAGPTSAGHDRQQSAVYVKSHDPERFDNMSMSYLADKGFFDWTRLPMSADLPEHIQFARSVDWARTSLGPIEEWSAELRGMCNLIMASPHPSAMYWGPEHVAIYNEPYIMLAGQKHPSLMGRRYRDAWSEIWEQLEDVFSNAMSSAQATMKDDDCLFIQRNGFLEETYFSWSIIPLIGDDGSVVGLYNPAFEKTRRKIAERRMLTLREIGERTAAARAVSQFWHLLVEGLQYNEYDAPMVLVYSLTDNSTEESDGASSASSVAAAAKVCYLEGSLGVEAGHPAAPRMVDLKHDHRGFAPIFKRAIASDKPIILNTDRDVWDQELLKGVSWRGFGDPSEHIIVCPVRPTTGESTLGFLVMGTNPRRPYDEDYDLFVQLLGRQLATSVASVVLFEEEIRKGERAAQMAAQDRIELSNQLAARTQEAVESENKFTRMAELAPVGMFIADANGKIAFANDAWYRLSGYPQDKVIGDDWLNYVSEQDQPHTRQKWTTMLQNRCEVSIDFRFKTLSRAHESTDSLLWVIASASPEIDEDGNIYRIFGSLTDISSQKHAEALQKKRVEEAVEMKRQQERYIDTTSHEMRNPLSAILQSADSIANSLTELRDGSSFSALQNEVLDSTIDSAQTITLCAQHQKRIVDDVLTLSKLDSAMLLVTPVDSQPVSVVHRALKMFEGELQTADIALDVRIDRSYYHLQIDWVRLDPTRLSQVLINLTTNAIKFTTTQEKRTIRMHVAASRERPSQQDRWKLTYIPSQSPVTRDVTAAPEWGAGEAIYIHFAVQDTGRGLTENERKQLFQRFSQANPRTHVTYGGSGLGLFISRELVELQGGEIGVASEAGKGSTFAFYVKARRSQAPASGSEDDMDMVHSRKGSKNAGSSKIGLSKLAQSIPASAPAVSPDSRTASAAVGTTMAKEPLKVLVVEDNLINQKVLAAQLRKIGCIVYVANHGGEAIDFIKRSTFHRSPESDPSTGAPLELSVVLMDLEMPVMDGITCARELRKMQLSEELVRHVPVIAVTANAREEQIKNTLEAGIDDVVSKPFRIPELAPKMHDVIQRVASQAPDDSKPPTAQPTDNGTAQPDRALDEGDVTYSPRGTPVPSL